MKIWTLGHSNRSAAALIELALSIPLDVLLDVRTIPRSKRNPQFDRDQLAWELEQVGIEYVHEKRLGGMRVPRPDSPHTGLEAEGMRGYADHMESASFREGVDELLQRAASQRCGLMCAEASPWHCHRSLLCDSLFARGVDVHHRIDLQTDEPHRLTPRAQLRGERVAYPSLL